MTERDAEYYLARIKTAVDDYVNYKLAEIERQKQVEEHIKKMRSLMSGEEKRCPVCNKELL